MPTIGATMGPSTGSESSLSTLIRALMRAIASSWAWSKGTSIRDICFAASWSSQNTFGRFYKLGVLSLAS